MLFDTDILIWVQKGNVKAARLIENTQAHYVSVLTYMELLQGARDKRDCAQIRRFLKDFSFHTLPLTESIAHRAAVYVEEYSLSHGLRAGDAIIAATATENGLTLCSSDARHFRPIKELRFELFRP